MKRNSDQILTEWLVLHAQSGNADALDQLLKIWYPKLLKYATHSLRNNDAAKDVVQETLISVAKGIRKVKDPAAFPKWIYQILQRRGADYLRKESRLRQTPVSDEYLEMETAENPHQRVDTRITLDKAFQNLKRESYQIVHLYYLIGLSLKDIAGLIGIPEGTVKSRLHTARNQLRQQLEE